MPPEAFQIAAIHLGFLHFAHHSEKIYMYMQEYIREGECLTIVVETLFAK